MDYIESPDFFIEQHIIVLKIVLTDIKFINLIVYLSYYDGQRVH